MSRYINDDIVLKPNSRKGVYLDKDSLVKMMKEIIDKEYGHFRSVLVDNYPIIVGNDNMLPCWLENDDGTYCLDEDDEYPNKEYPLSGYCTYENKFSWIGHLMGEDDEYEVFVIFYYDGNKLRSYIPKKGNLVNLDGNCPFDSHYYFDEKGNEINEHDILDKYINDGTFTRKELEDFFNSKDIYDNYTVSEAYIRKYGYHVENYDDIGFNWHAIMEDIKVTFGL